MDYIRSFAEIRAGDVGVVGGKGANLGEMTRAGLPVPPGFCLTAEAYRAFTQTSGAADFIQRVLAETRADDPEKVETNTARIREFFEEQSMPAEIQDQTLAHYHHLSDELGNNNLLRVAVRSSATAEDLPTASFAGQQDTYLNVRGDDDLLAHVKQCWASLWTARAVTYRVKQGFEHAEVALAVVVQAMIQSEVSGILFTANPVTSNRDEVVINASWGLGEAIVSGLVSPDTLTIRKSDGAIISREIADKDRSIEYAQAGGTVEVEVPDARRKIPALSDAQIAQLVALSAQIEKHYGAPMDIEWGYARGTFYILQARAITTLANVGAGLVPVRDTGEYNRTMFVEIFPDPLSPIFLSVIQPLFQSMLDFTFETLGFTPARGVDAVGVFYDQPYFHRGYIEAALQKLSPPVRERLVSQIVNPFGRQTRELHGEFSLSYISMTLRLLRFMVRFPAQLPGIVARYRAEIREAEALRVENISEREIVEHIRQLVFGTVSRLLNYDFLMIALIGITYQLLGTLLQPYFGEESEELRAKLISGVTGNVTMETNKRLWDLAQVAKKSPDVSVALQQNVNGEIQSRLGATRDGKNFLDELNRFLAEYGHREVRMDILYPTWGEDPAPVLAFLRRYLDLDESSSPYRQQERLVKQREELARTVQARLRRDLKGRLLVLPLFNWILKHTQAHTRERDTMHFELTRLFPPFRRLLLELGRRWAEKGFVQQPDDIFFLTFDELQQLADAPRSMQEVVAARRAEFKLNQQRGAPGILRDGKEISAEGAPLAEKIAGQFRGIAGSPGKVSGIARVIRGPEEFDKLHSGEILIAPLTNPVWTPLFAIAGGLVTEVGGILSHGAIVAREYGIPAVMAVAGATKNFQEGERVTVDGDKGVVYVKDEG